MADFLKIKAVFFKQENETSAPIFVLEDKSIIVPFLAQDEHKGFLGITEGGAIYLKWTRKGFHKINDKDLREHIEDLFADHKTD